MESHRGDSEHRADPEVQVKVEQAICLRNHVEPIVNKATGQRDDVTLTRGTEYTVSLPDAEGRRTVFTRYWFKTPGSLWGGAQ